MLLTLIMIAAPQSKWILSEKKIELFNPNPLSGHADIYLVMKNEDDDRIEAIG